MSDSELMDKRWQAICLPTQLFGLNIWLHLFYCSLWGFNDKIESSWLFFVLRTNKQLSVCIQFTQVSCNTLKKASLGNFYSLDRFWLLLTTAAGSSYISIVRYSFTHISFQGHDVDSSVCAWNNPVQQKSRWHYDSFVLVRCETGLK
jgi:hypothetical protein